MATLSPPTSPLRDDGRPRPRTSHSFMSSRSRRSSGSANKLELVESSKDKKRLNTKADPSKALIEAQPAAVALEDSNLEDIRGVQHRDVDGNVITDPDRSNPTRNRLERPLDTIRAFNAAAEGTTTRRSSFQNRPPTSVSTNGYENRRSSYYGNGSFSPQQRPRPGAGGYYRNSSYGFRPDSFAEEPAPPQPPFGRMSHPNQPYNGNNYGNHGNYGNGNGNGNSSVNGHGYGYGESSSPGYSYPHSYETMTSGSDDYGKSTNPSSQNSSFDRLHQMQTRKNEEYGQQEYPMPSNTPPSNGMAQYPPSNGMGQYPPVNGQNGNYGRPPPPRNAGPPPVPYKTRQPIQLTTSNSGPPPTMADLNKALPQKRQSWIRRKLSRRES